MRHGISGNKVGRNSKLREATMRDLAKSVLIHQKIMTTKAKAKEARKLVEKLITLGKKGDLASKRRAFAVLCDHQLVSRLFNELAPRFNSRQGGYTRIITAGLRRGDHAQLAFLELTEIVEKKVVEPKAKAKADNKTIDTTATVKSSTKKTEKEDVKEAEVEKVEEKAKSHETLREEKSKLDKKATGIKGFFKRGSQRGQ